MIERLVTDTHWSKVNSVFAAGQGNVRMAFIKDDIGNWNLKSFANDPTELVNAYKNAGLAALKAVAPGGRVVCAGIHMSDIPSFPYDILWREREIVSVANLTRRDGEAFLDLAPRIPVETTVEPVPLEQANEALARLRDGRLKGAAVLRISEDG